jgi:tetratricopeptide (TPR) repeat protein
VKRKNFISAILLWFHLLALPSLADENGVLSQIALANDLSLKSKYEEALSIYGKLINENYENAYVYYNMANIFYRLGEIENSILYYQRAKRLAPRDENIEANFRYVISKTEDKIYETPTPFINQILVWLDDFRFWELVKGLILFNILFWASLTLNIWFKTEFFNYLKKGTGVLLIAMIASVSVKSYYQNNYLTGVAMAERIEIKSGQGDNNVTLFQLHKGAIFRILAEENDWYKIELSDKKSGWAPKINIAKV